MGIPYIAIIGYTNSFDKENDYFLGNYHGILSSSIKTIGEDIAICWCVSFFILITFIKSDLTIQIRSTVYVFSTFFFGAGF